jgi:hypothetical protein
MIDIEKLERLAHEAEGAARAMWQEVYELSKAMRDNDHPDTVIAADDYGLPSSIKIPTMLQLTGAAKVMHKLVNYAKKDPVLWRKIMSGQEDFDAVTAFLNQILIKKYGAIK